MKKILLSLLFLPLFLIFSPHAFASTNFSIIKAYVDPSNNHFVFSADKDVVDFPVTISLVSADHSTVYATSSSFSHYAASNTSGIFNTVNSYPSCGDNVAFDINDGNADYYSYPISASALYPNCPADTSFPTPQAPSTIYTVGASNYGLGLGQNTIEFHDWSGPVTPVDCDDSKSYLWDGNVGVIHFSSCSPTGATLTQNLVSGHYIQLFYYDSSGNYWTSSFLARDSDDPEDPAQINTLSGGTINQGDTYTENGSFTSSSQYSMTATVDYGDGSGSQPLTLNSDDTFTLNHIYSTTGHYVVAVNIVDSIGVTGTSYAIVIVNSNPPQINSLNGGTIASGDTYSENGSFTDSDSTSWTATVDYGDGVGVEPLTLNSDNTFSLSHQYTAEGTYNVTVNISDNQGGTGTATATITVNPPAPITLTPVADTYIKSNSKGQNEGSSPILSIQDTGNTRALVQFDESQIQAAVGSSSNYTATLQFTIVATGNNGSTGRQVDVDRMILNWAEGNGYIAGNSTPNRGTGSGADWYCAIDTNIANDRADCSGSNAWDMTNAGSFPFVTTPTATTTVVKNQTGTVSFDVTPDVQSFLNGTNTNDGWLVKLDNESMSGKVQLGSKDSGNAPQLIITQN